MPRKTALLASALMLSTALTACAMMPGGDMTAPPVVTAPVEYVRDIHSHAQPEIARVVHIDLDLNADFDAKVLSGTATLDVTAEPGATELIHIGQAVISLGGTVDYFVESAFNYPTLAECYRVAALNGMNKLRLPYKVSPRPAPGV